MSVWLDLFRYTSAQIKKSLAPAVWANRMASSYSDSMVPFGNMLEAANIQLSSMTAMLNEWERHYQRAFAAWQKPYFYSVSACQHPNSDRKAKVRYAGAGVGCGKCPPGNLGILPAFRNAQLWVRYRTTFSDPRWRNRAP